MPYLKFISDKNLISAIGKVVRIIETTEREASSNLHKNVIDPFSAIFHGVTHAITYKEWIKQEKARQSQKTMQNAIGDFHQEVLGAIPGWENLGVGGGLDVANDKMKIIAEVKNKFNTTKGNHKVEIYDAIKSKLKSEKFHRFTGYYVEIIPQAKNIYDKPFTPSDNKTQKRRTSAKNIRIIDGISFYALATGRKYALQELFEALSHILVEKYKFKLSKKEAKKYFELFKLAFFTK